MFKKHQIKLRQAAPFSFPLYKIDKRNQADPSLVQVMSNVWLPPKIHYLSIKTSSCCGLCKNDQVAV